MYKILLTFAGLLLSAQLVWAQNPYEVSFGDYTINYNAFPSTTLEPSIANALDITRASYRGLVTIAVRKGEGNPVDAKVKGTVTNLLGQRPKLKFQRVKDAESLYYLGQFDIPRDSSDQLTFNITVQPNGETKKKTIEFKRSY